MGSCPGVNFKGRGVRWCNGHAQKDGLVLPLQVANASAETIKLQLTHEWHGGKWPSTSLFASVIVKGDKDRPPFTPVYVAREDPNGPRDVIVAPGKSSTVELRMDWLGTGSVPTDPLIRGPGRYTGRFAVVFEVNGKRQYVTSGPIEIELKGD